MPNEIILYIEEMEKIKMSFEDYHVHTAFSDDSTYDMEEVIQDAIQQGINELCFTDHVDYGIKVDWDEGKEIIYRNNEPMANVDYPKYFEKIKEMKEKYPQITLKQGLEFGMQEHTIDRFEKLYDKYDFDFIILSCHQVENQEFWNGEFQKGRTQKEYNERYYREILNVIQKYKNYSVLGHLDLIVRYDQQGVYPFENVKPIITQILKQVIADGKGIEINTSSHRYGLSDLQPSRNILKLYRELGGTIITIGSDSHKKEHLGAYIQDTKEELKKLGYTQYCTFEHMQPIYHTL